MHGKAGSTPQGFVNALFHKLAGRPARPGEMQYWANQYSSQGALNVAYGVLMRTSPNTTRPIHGYHRY